MGRGRTNSHKKVHREGATEPPTWSFEDERKSLRVRCTETASRSPGPKKRVDSFCQAWMPRFSVQQVDDTPVDLAFYSHAVPIGEIRLSDGATD